MAVTLDMPEDIEAQFAAAAKARGVPLSEYLRDFIVERYQEEAYDLHTAKERLADSQPGLTPAQLRRKLGLDD
jgi:predicted DNA-binding protein